MPVGHQIKQTMPDKAPIVSKERRGALFFFKKTLKARRSWWKEGIVFKRTFQGEGPFTSEEGISGKIILAKTLS